MSFLRVKDFLQPCLSIKHSNRSSLASSCFITLFEERGLRFLDATPFDLVCEDAARL